jgi:protein SCO1/2
VRHLRLAAILCVIAGAVAGLLTAKATSPSSAVTARFIPPRQPAFDFRLRDQDGRVASIAQARGKVVALTFMYSTCHDLCPAQASEIGEAVEKAGGGVMVYIVSVDPVGDTPARARLFLKRRELDDGDFRFLLGTRAQLAPVWRAYGIAPIGAGPREAAAAAAATERHLRRSDEASEYYEYSRPRRSTVPEAATERYPNTNDLRYRGLVRHEAGWDFEHTAYVLLLDKHGVQRVGLPFEHLTSDSLAQDLKLLLAER